MEHAADTIAAPATAAGGAVALIRISGTEAFAVCDRIFRGKIPLAEAAPHTVHYGRIMDGNRMVDEVLTTVFHSPRSYTGEDAVEISCHGSRYIVSEILRLLLGAGARLAQPGEFTTRAFLAGKMDLAQAEAVADLIASSSRASHALATNQLRGAYSASLSILRKRLVELASLLELELDFSEEDVEFVDRNTLRHTMQELEVEFDRLCRSFSLGNALKRGVTVAIVGEPNVGKSTLLNRLLGEERALVSEIAGTTRDSIEETLDIDGVLFRFIDTAGLRETDDRIERMGIERTLAAMERAEIILHLSDAGLESRAADTDRSASRMSKPVAFEPTPDQSLIEVINKIDMAPDRTIPSHAVAISAREGTGLETLRNVLREKIDPETVYHGDAVVSSARHYEALTAAREALIRTITALDNDQPADLLSEEIRSVLHHLGTVTGEITTDEILGTIFSKFCIGK